MPSERSQSSGTFTSSPFFRWCHDNIVFLFVRACAFGCMRREKGAGTQCRALTSMSTPTTDSSPFITPAQPHTLASFLPCLLVFLSISLAALEVGGGQEADQSVQKMYHWQSQCERSEVNPEVSHNSTQELICSSTFLHRDFALFRLDLTWLNTLSDWLV